MNELALRFVAAEQEIDALLVGACQPKEIEENVSRFALGPLPPACTRRSTRSRVIFKTGHFLFGDTAPQETFRSDLQEIGT
jgi:hypothetical protein